MGCLGHFSRINFMVAVQAAQDIVDFALSPSMTLQFNGGSVIFIQSIKNVVFMKLSLAH
jgi:hypothetical protein